MLPSVDFGFVIWKLPDDIEPLLANEDKLTDVEVGVVILGVHQRRQVVY